VVFEVGDEVIISRTSGIIVTVTRTETQRETEAHLVEAEDEAGLEVLQVGTEEGEVRDFHKERDSHRLHSHKKVYKEAFLPEPKMIRGRTSLEEMFGNNHPTPSRLL
jgi:hypothetical protein